MLPLTFALMECEVLLSIEERRGAGEIHDSTERSVQSDLSGFDPVLEFRACS